ncbi:hypothetical protein U5N28_01480 [Lysinibacillus telephonicus]|uniref:hypothetical protein n=1 Tax=Lysinibacillus telephonicus TaxID=1714840 RepID=UPI0031FBFC9E
MNIESTFDVVATVFNIIAWSGILFWVYRVYKKQIIKPEIWKMLIVMIVGLFSFSIKFNLFQSIINIPILPLGVWILYFILKRREESWQKYRSFAWVGFWANFIFLAATLLTLPIHYLIYPNDKLSTYISNIEHAAIVTIHPSGNGQPLVKDDLLNQLETMEKQKINSSEWYQDIVINSDTNERNERFPYQLVGTFPKWGSGLHSIIYIEEDGKGILVSTPKEQLYFRSEMSLIERVE